MVDLSSSLCQRLPEGTFGSTPVTRKILPSSPVLAVHRYKQSQISTDMDGFGWYKPSIYSFLMDLVGINHPFTGFSMGSLSLDFPDSWFNSHPRCATHRS